MIDFNVRENGPVVVSGPNEWIGMFSGGPGRDIGNKKKNNPEEAPHDSRALRAGGHTKAAIIASTPSLCCPVIVRDLVVCSAGQLSHCDPVVFCRHKVSLGAIHLRDVLPVA